MINAILKSLEDPDRPLFGPNYWLLNKIGLLLPENFIQRVLKIVFHELGTFFVLSQYMELYVIRSDLDLVLTNLKISMLSTVCIIKANTFVFWQNNWRQLVDYITDADKFERDHQDAAKGKILNSYTKYCRRVTYFYWGLVFTTFLTVITTPLMKYYSSPTFREGFLNGTEPFPHIFSSWVPFDKEQFPGCWLTVLWHITICAYGATVVAAYDSSAMVILVYFGGKLELLRIRCREMLGTRGLGISDHDAEKVIRQLHQIHVLLLNAMQRTFFTFPYHEEDELIIKRWIIIYKVKYPIFQYLLESSFNCLNSTYFEYLDAINVSVVLLSQLIVFFWPSNRMGSVHLQLLDEESRFKIMKSISVSMYSRIFNSVLSPVMFFYVVMCSLMICASAFQLTSATNTTQKLLMAEFLIFSIAQLFIFCWHSNDVIYKNQGAILGPYESEWWAASLNQRNSILILQGQMKIVHIYTAGPFTNLTLSTFIAILKGAYSYYTLLRK